MILQANVKVKTKNENPPFIYVLFLTKSLFSFKTIY